MKKSLLYFLMVCAFQVSAQISGTVLDIDGSPLIGATVLEQGTYNGTITDIDGSFTLVPVMDNPVLIVSYTGFANQIVTVDGNSVTVNLAQGTTLDEVVVTGSRGKARTVIGSPVPIDNINADQLRASGQVTLDQMLNFKVPSYNSTNQTISDATAHFDPSELRNLGPSRTLVLVNGKRKNQSSLVYVNDTPGKGEVGTDMKSIPSEAIERVEVLRDGAAAQYGSDAIAGVVNIILKEGTDGQVTANTGITTEGDGLTYDLGVNKGLKVGKGFLNLTGSYYHQDETNRAGEPGGDGLFGVIFGDDDILNGTHPWIQENPDLGMTIGQPKYDKLSVLANFGIPINESAEAYATLGYTFRDGTSFALYRAPYWITDDAGLLTPDGEAYQGFQPTFETAINDITFTAGLRRKYNGWDTDGSFTYGANTVDYRIGNTINPALLPNSPTEFDAGAYSFENQIVNIDVSKSFEPFTVSLGTEVRREAFGVTAGQMESYVDGGAQSFPGLQPDNELEDDEGSRTNVGVYGGVDYDLSENTFIGGAMRFENYSDFGSNLSWKVNARQYIGGQKGAIRASVSTGFRAPSLHQIYLSNIQTLVSGGTVSNQGTFNNVSEVVRGLGVPALDAETSFNMTAGFTYRLTNELSFSADYYNVTVDNRVLFTGEIGFDGDDTTINPVEEVLNEYMVTSIKYFVNALDTRTSGFDIVLDYNTPKFDAVLSANLNETKIENEDDISSPGVVGEQGYEIFNRKEQSRITSARPNVKALLGLTYKMDKLSVSLNNTYFGDVTWQHAVEGGTVLDDGSLAPDLDQTFGARLVTDLLLSYKATDAFRINLTGNNIFNVYPEVIEPGSDFVTDLGGRFKYPWEVNQFGFLGTVVKLGLSYDF